VTALGPGVWLALSVGLASTIIAISWSANRPQRTAIRGAAKALGLTSRVGFFGDAAARGVLEAQRVRVRAAHDHEPHAGLVVEVADMPADVALSTSKGLLKLAPGLVPDRLEVGDGQFDGAVLVRTRNPARGRGLLSAATREAVLSVLRHQPRMQEGAWLLRAHTSEGTPSAADLAAVIQEAVRTGRVWRRAEADPNPLLNRCLDDPEPEVRRRCLAAFFDEGGVLSERDARALLATDVEELMLAGARVLGFEALRALGASAQHASSRFAVLDAALAKHAEHPEMVHMALDAEPWLGRMATTEGDDRLRALTLIGRIGTPRSLPMLRLVVRDTWPGNIRKEARLAVAAIEGRAGDSSGGRLSLSREQAGQLSEPESSD
jgi:hypothetical protein